MLTRHPRYFVPVHSGDRLVHFNGRVFFVTRARWTGTILVFGYADQAQYHLGTSSAFWTFNGHRFPVRKAA